MNELVLTCILMVTTPQGNICIKPDATVEIPAEIKLDEASRLFWEKLAITAPYLCDTQKKQ